MGPAASESARVQVLHDLVGRWPRRISFGPGCPGTCARSDIRSCSRSRQIIADTHQQSCSRDPSPNTSPSSRNFASDCSKMTISSSSMHSARSTFKTDTDGLPSCASAPTKRARLSPYGTMENTHQDRGKAPRRAGRCCLIRRVAAQSTDSGTRAARRRSSKDGIGRNE